MSVKHQPDGYNTVSPYLICKGAAAAIEFYISNLGAKERMRLAGPGNSVMHAELEIGDTVVMISDEFPEMNAISPETLGGTAVGLLIYTENCDSMIEKSTAAGAVMERPVEDQFYGDRSGTFFDPYGHRWTIATHIEDLTAEEMEKRFAEMSAGE